MTTRRSVTSTTSQKVNLPKWAVLVEPEEEVGIEPVTLHDEEAYIRTRCYHEASRFLDEAWEQTLHEASSRVRENIMPTTRSTKTMNPNNSSKSSQSLLGKRSLSEVNSNEITETIEKENTGESPPEDNIDSIASLRNQFTIDTSWSAAHDAGSALLLPLNLLSGPSNALDRLAWMKRLVDTARRRNTASQSGAGAVIWLQRGPPSLWVTEILRQLLLLEPVGQNRGSGLKQLSAIEAIKVWCRSTTRFKYIQIYFDMQSVNTATTPSFPPVNHFLSWLAHVRANHGVPFSAVVLESSGPRRHDLCSYEQGTDGLIVNRQCLEHSTQLVKNMFSNPLVSDLVVVLFQNNNDDSMDRADDSLWSIFESTGSAVLVITEWKRRLANFLASPGSFLALHWETWLKKERRRLDWMSYPQNLEKFRMLSDDSPSSVLDKWREEAMTKRTMASVAWQIQHIVMNNCAITPTSFDIWKSIVDRKPFIQPIARVLSISRENKSSPHLLDSLNELVILIENCSNVQEVSRCLNSYKRVWETHWKSLPLFDPPHIFAHATQPRRDLVEGLSDAGKYGYFGIVIVAGLLYSFLNHRVSIGALEWMQSFLEETKLDESEASAFFSIGVNILKIHGLIRERRAAGRSEGTFEKTAVVFSSGA